MRKKRPRPAAPNRVRDEILTSARDRARDFIEHENEVKLLIERDPDYPLNIRKLAQQEVANQTHEMRKLLEACAPYVAKMKPLVLNIAEKTVESACYLLFSHAVQSFDAILLLANEGFNHQITELLRGIREAIDLAVLFMYEGQCSANLNKWFDGEIISNDTSRKAFERFINEGRNSPLAVGETKSGLYSVISHFSHMSYIGLFESIDVFSRAFDVSRIAGFHYTATSSLPYAKTSLRSMVVALKQFDLSRGDENSYVELDQVFGLFGGS
jgi:hypothetical protein